MTTVNGLAGLTDADIPDGITASNYLPLSGGSLTGDLSLSGTLTAGTLAVSGVSSGGAINAPYINATDTAATSTFSGGLLGSFAHITAGLIDTLTSTIANFGTITAVNETITNSTTTNSYSTNLAAASARFGATATSTFTSDGKLGIGTASPLGILDISQNASNNIIYLNNTSGTSRRNQIVFRGVTSQFSLINDFDQIGNRDFRIQDSAAGAARLFINSSGDVSLSGSDASTSPAFIALASGNVGIGTVSPTRTLHLNTSSGSTVASFTTVGSGSTITDGFYVGMTNADLKAWLWNYEDAAMGFGTNNSERMTLSNAGNLGIANTSPTYKLDVTGLGHFIGLVDAANFVATSTSATTTLSGMLAVGSNALNVLSNGRVGIGTANPGVKLQVVGQSSPMTAGGAAGGLAVTSIDGLYGLYAGVDPTSGNSWLQAARNDSATYYDLLLQARGGNVGIATTSPSAKLAITGGGTGTGRALSVANSADTERFAVQDDGRVYINAGASVTYPSGYALNVSSLTDTYLTLKAPANNTSGVFFNEGSAAVGSVQHNNSTYGTVARRNDTELSSDTGDVNVYTSSDFTTPKFSVTNAGNIGIGTTTPWRTLSVTGTVGFDGLTGSTGAGSLCLDSNKQVVYNSASDNCLSSTRATKHDITPLSLDNLQIVNALQPVSFVYNQGDGRVRYGFIAEDTAAVDAHLATYNASGTVSGIDDRSIIAILVAAVKEIASITGKFRDALIAWFGSATNGIGDLFVCTLHARDQLCVDDVCVTRDELLRMKEGRAAAGTPQEAPLEAPTVSPAPLENGADAPTLSINGNDPALIEVNHSYADLGATITAPEADTNLGIHTFVDGIATDPVTIDTSVAATHSIDYVVTGLSGLTSTSTRTVIVQAANNNTPLSPLAATGTQASSLAQ